MDFDQLRTLPGTTQEEFDQLQEGILAMGVINELEEPTIETVVFEALGEASMCWSETPKGVFDSVNAQRIGDELIQAIKEWAKKQPQEMDGT